jgi:hypothetical protein
VPIQVFSKQFDRRISTDGGMKMDFNEQRLKHNSENSVTCDSVANANESITQSENHNLPSIVIERGIWIDMNEHLEKLDSSISFNCDPGSNVIVPTLAS